MRPFSLAIIYLIVTSAAAWGQQDYFLPENKLLGMKHYQNKIYQGCPELNKKQDPVSPSEMNQLALKTKNVLLENFSQAFKENPQVKRALLEDLLKLSNSSDCQLVANDCRAQLLSLSMYYMYQFRGDIPDCEVDSPRCEVEKTYRKRSLQGVRNNYGKIGPGSYKKELIAQKNNTTISVFNTVLMKDKSTSYFCHKPYRYDLNSEFEGNYLTGLDPYFSPTQELIEKCVEEKTTLYSEFLPTSFDTGRTTVGQDQVEPVKKKVSDFLKSHPEMIFTDVKVTASSSKAPFYQTVAGKKGLDPKSNEKNLSLANERGIFVRKALNEIQESSSSFSEINFNVRSELGGPDFSPMDLNDRFVTKMTPGYLERVEALFERNKNFYEKQALKTGASELFHNADYGNLYETKFKPYQGFRIEIQGFIKGQMKCLDQSPSKSFQNGSSKQ